MTLPQRFDHLAPYFEDDGPASEALAAHQHAHGLLVAAREKVRDLTSPAKVRAAEVLDEAAIIEAAASRKATPKPVATSRLADETADARRLVAALVPHVERVRREALDAVAADTPRRLDVLEERRAAAAARAEHLADEMAEALAEVAAVAETRAVLAAVMEGNALALDGEVRAVMRAASQATGGNAVQVPRTAFGDVEIAVALAAVVAHAQRVPEVQVFDRGMTPAERLGSRTPTLDRSADR